MSFVRNLFFSVFLGVWGTLSAQEERVIPVPREVLPGTGEFRISEVDGIGLYRNRFVLRFAVIAAIDEAG